MKKLLLFLGVGAIVAGGMPDFPMAGEKVIVNYEIKASYEDVTLDLENALLNAGLLVNNIAHVANMLNRTAADVGATKQVYKHGKVFEFCSAKLSRATMEADPLNMGYCPYTIFVYQTVARPEMVTVGYRRLAGASSKASKQALEAVNALLDKLVREATGQ